MRNRRLTREEALEEYLVYRKRIREFLDLAQIATDVKEGKYSPRDLLGRGPERFSEALADVITGLFSSMCDRNASALNVFDVWLVLFPEKKDKINETWEKIEPQVKAVRNYRNDVVAHTNKNLRRYVKARLGFHEKRQEIVEALQKFFGLAAELMRAESTTMPELGTEVDPIIKKIFPALRDQEIQILKDYFLGGGGSADGEPSD